MVTSKVRLAQARRLMEVENQKARKTKRREFNETVRELAAFVRKRDKRVAAYQVGSLARRLACAPPRGLSCRKRRMRIGMPRRHLSP